MSIVYYRSGTNGTYIIYGCHQVPSSTVKSECTSRGNWNPNPAHHLCKHGIYLSYSIPHNIIHACMHDNNIIIHVCDVSSYHYYDNKLRDITKN